MKKLDYLLNIKFNIQSISINVLITTKNFSFIIVLVYFINHCITLDLIQFKMNI